MASFEISTATDRLSVDAGSERELTFTITSTGGDNPLAKIWIECDSAAAAAAVRFVGENENVTETLYHQFQSSDAHTVRIKVAPPESSETIETGLKLVIADDRQIETTKKYGPPVRLSIKEKLPPPPPEPSRWWLWAIIAAVVVVVGGSVGFYYSTRVEFPNIVGASEGTGTNLFTALKLADEAGLDLYVSWDLTGSNIPAGTVVVVPYAPGDMVSTLFTVDVVATLPEVPRVEGQAWSSVQNQFANFDHDVKWVANGSVDPGQVDHLEPNGGQRIDPGVKIVVTVRSKRSVGGGIDIRIRDAAIEHRVDHGWHFERFEPTE